MIDFRVPPRTGCEISFRIFGIHFRILPSFFLFSALLAGVFIWPLVPNDWVSLAIGIAIDVACIFGAIVFTELVQGLVYRSYGIRSTVLIQEFFGGIYPDVEPPTALQRIMVALANPFSCVLLYAIVYYSNQEWQWAKQSQLLEFAYLILKIVSVFWAIIGLLPIFPYPGGRVMLEFFVLASRRHGLSATLLVSIILGIAYIVYTIAVFKGMMRQIPLIEGYRLPAEPLVAIFMGLTVFRNWELFRAVRQQYKTPELTPYDENQKDYDDRPKRPRGYDDLDERATGRR